MATALRDATVLDTVGGELLANRNVAAENDRRQVVADRLVRSTHTEVIDVRWETRVPGRGFEADGSRLADPAAGAGHV